MHRPGQVRRQAWRARVERRWRGIRALLVAIVLFAHGGIPGGRDAIRAKVAPTR